MKHFQDISSILLNCANVVGYLKSNSDSRPGDVVSMVGLSNNPPPFPNIPVAATVITTLRSLLYFKGTFLSPAITKLIAIKI